MQGPNGHLHLSQFKILNEIKLCIYWTHQWWGRLNCFQKGSSCREWFRQAPRQLASVYSLWFVHLLLQLITSNTVNRN